MNCFWNPWLSKMTVLNVRLTGALLNLANSLKSEWMEVILIWIWFREMGVIVFIKLCGQPLTIELYGYLATSINFQSATYAAYLVMTPALLALCEGHPPVTGWLPSHSASNAVMWNLMFTLCQLLNKWSICWRCGTQRRLCNVTIKCYEGANIYMLSL